MFEKTLNPPELRGTPDQLPVFPAYEWIKQLPNNKSIFLALWQHWRSQDLPLGYDHYIVSFHLEAVNLPWLEQQTKLINSPIIVLFDGNSYNCTIPGVTFVPYYYWHEQVRKIIRWYGIKGRKNPEYKFSAVCSRATQSKIWITTELLERATEHSLISLDNHIDLKDVHQWGDSGDAVLDQLTSVFRHKYLGKSIKFDSFENKDKNNQLVTSNPWQPALSKAAVHFTNESFHYSYMKTPTQEYIHPGPFLTEKTMKCLISGCSMVPVGQFETYKTLKNFGLNFDYSFDTSWDQDFGNVSRMRSIVDLVKDLGQYSVDELEHQNREVNMHNQQWLKSGAFWNAVNQHNSNAVEQIFELIKD